MCFTGVEAWWHCHPPLRCCHGRHGKDRHGKQKLTHSCHIPQTIAARSAAPTWRTWPHEQCHQMDPTNQVTRFSFGVLLSMPMLLLQRHGRRKGGSEVLSSLKKVLWSMFMLTMQSCVSTNRRSGVIMMNDMMLLFLDLTIQSLFHLQLKMKMTMNQT